MSCSKSISRSQYRRQVKSHQPTQTSRLATPRSSLFSNTFKMKFSTVVATLAGAAAVEGTGFTFDRLNKTDAVSQYKILSYHQTKLTSMTRFSLSSTTKSDSPNWCETMVLLSTETTFWLTPLLAIYSTCPPS